MPFFAEKVEVRHAVATGHQGTHFYHRVSFRSVLNTEMSLIPHGGTMQGCTYTVRIGSTPTSVVGTHEAIPQCLRPKQANMLCGLQEGYRDDGEYSEPSADPPSICACWELFPLHPLRRPPPLISPLLLLRH